MGREQHETNAFSKRAVSIGPFQQMQGATALFYCIFVKPYKIGYRDGHIYSVSRAEWIDF